MCESLDVCLLGAADGGGGQGVLVTSQHGNKSRSCCHKTQPLRPAFKCCLYSQRAADTLQRGEREKKRKKGSRKEREREREARGVSRPVAEGLILNVLQRQCLLSSLASPLTAPASKQDLSPLPPPNRKRGRKRGRQWLLKMIVLFASQMLSLPQKVVQLVSAMKSNFCYFIKLYGILCHFARCGIFPILYHCAKD